MEAITFYLTFACIVLIGAFQIYYEYYIGRAIVEAYRAGLVENDRLWQV